MMLLILRKIQKLALDFDIAVILTDYKTPIRSDNDLIAEICDTRLTMRKGRNDVIIIKLVKSMALTPNEYEATIFIDADGIRDVD